MEEHVPAPPKSHPSQITPSPLQHRIKDDARRQEEEQDAKTEAEEKEVVSPLPPMFLNRGYITSSKKKGVGKFDSVNVLKQQASKSQQDFRRHEIIFLNQISIGQ